VEESNHQLKEEEESAMNITTIGLDIAKNVFQLHGVDANGKVALRKQLKRVQVLAFFANLSPCLIGLEACGGAHYWARELLKLGHDARLISPQFVKPYVKGNKNDANDAEAICEAVGRPSDVATLNRTHFLKYSQKSVSPNESQKTQHLYSRIQSLSGPAGERL
jgi:transposase